MYGHNNGSISSGDIVSTVINHALWLWPHKGTRTQEVETLNVQHTPKAELNRRGWSPGLLAPKRMHGPGPKEPPDVGPSGAPYEFG